MSKTIDSSVDYFWYRADLTIDPPLPDAKVKAGDGQLLSCRQFKDETVDIVNGELTVVSKNVTQVSAKANPDVMQYEDSYKDLKANVKTLATLAKDAGSTLSGYVFIRTNDNRFFRLNVVNNAVKVEAALLAWPDGTTQPLPDEESA